MTQEAFEVSRRELDEGRAELRFSGSLEFVSAAAVWKQVRGCLDPPARELSFDLSAVQILDGGTAALLLELVSEARRRGSRAEIAGAGGRVREILDLYVERESRRGEPALDRRVGFLDQIGRATIEFTRQARAICSFVGEAVLAWLASLRAPRTVRWSHVGRLMERTGADALPIVLLITFLIGIVTAYNAAIQLKEFGANIFVADIVGLGITREFGPLMVAIIAAGRSGAAFAAEIGTMRVSEEIDALHTLGIDPYRFLVFPRIMALVLVMPLLTLIGDAVGIAGGLLVAVLDLDLTISAYLIELRGSIDAWDVFSGVVKSVFFAGAIALIACQRGLSTRGGAEGVGISTTSAVVAILFSIILIDSVFTVIFSVFDI